MLLAVDVGNTSVTLGVFHRGRLVARGRMPTTGAYRKTLREFFSVSHTPPGQIKAAVICSVVPRATPKLRQVLKAFKRKPLEVGRELKAPVINRYRIPAQVGQDRLVNAAAAYFLYGGPAIVVDFGTAVTFDLVSRRREYLGGLIFPGMGIASEALAEKAALLPKIRLLPPRQLLGRDTVSSMRGGLFYGYAAMCDGLIRQIRKKIKPMARARVIATGGHSQLVFPFSHTIEVLDPDLTLQGLRICYENSP